MVAERALEGGPVVEVERAADPLAERAAGRAPGAVADALVPRLEVVDRPAP